MIVCLMNFEINILVVKTQHIFGPQKSVDGHAIELFSLEFNDFVCLVLNRFRKIDII